MRLVEPVTGCIVETQTEEATALLMGRGFLSAEPVAQDKPKPKPRKATTRRTATKKKE